MLLYNGSLKFGNNHLKKVGAYIVSIDRKTTVYRLEAFEIPFFFKNSYQAVHSNAFPYFTDQPVRSSL